MPSTPSCEVRLLICVTFLFRTSRLSYLFQVLQGLGDLPVKSLEVVVFTETEDTGELAIMSRLFGKLCDPNMSIRVSSNPSAKANLRLLPWAHKCYVRDVFSSNDNVFTHLLYIEEDIRFGVKNLNYFLQYNELLKSHGVIPGFIRVEFNNTLADITVSDTPQPNGLDARKRIEVSDFDFVCLDEPYTGMYMMDAEQVREYIQTKSFNLSGSLDVIGWGEPERAAMGLTFENPPSSHRWRLVLPIDRRTLTPRICSWVHHIPNNYANNYKPDGNFKMGKIRIDEMFV